MPDTPKPGRPHSLGIHTWVSTVAALIALAFSTYNFLDGLPDPPQTEVAPPRLIRMDWHKKNHALSVFIQPSVSTRVETDTVEVITDARLTLTPVGGAKGTPSPVPHFFWQQAVKWSYDKGSGDIFFTYLADPAPFSVIRDEPQLPSLHFTALDWTPTASALKGTLMLHRASGQDPIGLPVCIRLQDPDVTSLTGTEGYREFRSDVPGKPSDGCYHWFG
ncbi:hypothetical protein [Streptomyces sp. NPDC089799]|uniref:hypothetical protein n=1 Tax=Streptomyces sp. NPDC089799 TaxID=3155066 RepID=UPI0034215B94